MFKAHSITSHICETLSASSSPCVRIDIPVDVVSHIHIMILSVRHAYSDDVVALCTGPVDLDIRNKNGDTPLHVALKEIDDAAKRFDIVKELLGCGAEYKQYVVPCILVRQCAECPQGNARRTYTIGICTNPISFGTRFTRDYSKASAFLRRRGG